LSALVSDDTLSNVPRKVLGMLTSRTNRLVMEALVEKAGHFRADRFELAELINPPISRYDSA